MVLRESFEDEESAAVFTMLDDHPKLKRTLASRTFQTDKRKENSPIKEPDLQPRPLVSGWT
jgi:hypothetical protein